MPEWCDRPPVPGNWRELSPDERARVAERLHRAEPAGRVDWPAATQPRSIERIRLCEMPFYRGRVLLDVQVNGRIGGASQRAIASFVLGPDGLRPLDGTSPPIHALNAIAIDLGQPAQQLAYLRFFCAFVRGDLGPFRIVETVADLEFRPRVPARRKAALAEQVAPLRAEAGEETPSAGAEFTANVVYGAALFRSRFSIGATGMIEMLDDTPIETDLPIRPRRYRSVYRFAPE